MSAYHVEHDQPNVYDELLESVRTAPVGKCQAPGCDEDAVISKKTDSRWGHIKGQPQPFCPGHVGYNGNQAFLNRS